MSNIVSYNVDDNGVLRIYQDNKILCEISDCQDKEDIGEFVDEILDELYIQEVNSGSFEEPMDIV